MTRIPRSDAGGQERPNVLLFVIDTTRGAETVPSDPSVTPNLSALADAGTEFTRAFSVAPWTLPSHASLFTGTYPTRHGAHSDHTRLDGALPTLAEAFATAGYETAGVSNNVWVTEEFGLARGFEIFEEYGERSTAWNDADASTDGIEGWLRGREWGALALDAVGRLAPDRREGGDGGAARTVEWVRNWLEARSREDPFFLFANCIEPHLEYRPPRRLVERFLPRGWSYAEAMSIRQDPREYDVGEFDLSAEEWAVLRGLYRAEIAHVDERIGAVREALEAAGEWEDTVTVVMSDHGENVGEHGFLGHQYSLYDTVVHVPLVVHGGAFADGRSRSDRLVQTVDVAPTLLDAAGISAPEARSAHQGWSFHPDADTSTRSKVVSEYRGPRPPVEVLEEKFETVPEEIHDLQRSLRAVRTERYKYVRGSDGSRELYDLAADPGEANDVSGVEPERVAELDAALEGWVSSFEHADTSESGSVSVSGSTEERLADLGYL
jgi:arylsulfatase A-like enzyme